MTKKRVLISRRLPEAVMDSANSSYEVIARDAEVPLSIDEARSSLAEFDGIVPTLGDGFSAEAFASSRPLRCRILANFGAGYNHIDSAAAAWHGITVTNTPGAVTDATADIALTLILTTARRIVEGDRLARSGTWVGWQPTQMLGSHVTGKTLGIIGMGRIGQAVAHRCHFGFGMKVVYFSRSPKSDLPFPAEQLDKPGQVMNAADFVVVALPGGTETHHFINDGLLSTMQPHAFLINVSRGDVVDEDALIVALENKTIAGAGLDVYEFEPLIPGRLLDMDNVVLLPHLGTSVLEVREAMGFMALENLKAFFAGEEPPNPV